MSLDERNAELDEKLKENPIDEAIAVLFKQAKRNKNNIRLLALSFTLSLFITFGLGYLGFTTFKLVKQADTNTNALVRNCNTTNEARANNKQLWDYLLSAEPIEPRTPQEQAQIDDFEQLVNRTFAPRDCTKVIQ